MDHTWIIQINHFLTRMLIRVADVNGGPLVSQDPTGALVQSILIGVPASVSCSPSKVAAYGMAAGCRRYWSWSPYDDNRLPRVEAKSGSQMSERISEVIK